MSEHRREPHRWRKGESGNPRGRPPTGMALAERIRERVDLDELIDIALEIARGKGIQIGLDENGDPMIAIPRPSDRLAAIGFLCDRGYPKPPAMLDVDLHRDGPPVDFSRLSAEELVTFETLLTTATAPTLAIVPELEPEEEPDAG